MVVAEKMLRDVAAMLFVNQGGRDGACDPDVFLDTAEDINGKPLDTDLREHVLCAYYERLQDRGSIWAGEGAADEATLYEKLQRCHFLARYG